MTTQITKTYGAGKDFADRLALRAYVNSLDLVASDQNVKILMYENLLNVQMGPISWDDTRRVELHPAPNLGVNDLNRSTLDVGSSGIAITSTRNLETIGGGIDWYDLRILVTGSGSATCANFTGHAANATYDNIIARCRFEDSSTATVSILNGGISNNRLLITDCLSVSDGAANPYQFAILEYGTVTVRRTAFVARGAAKGTGTAMNASSATDCVFIGFASAAVSGTSLINCYTNTLPSGGTTTGLTVVVGTNALVVNEDSNYFPAPGSALIGAGSVASKNTMDILSQYRGENPDIGAVMRTAAAIPAAPDATITSTTILGQKVVIKGTFTNPATGGTPTLTAGSPANGAVTIVGNLAITSGINFTATFTNVHPGSYLTPTISGTNVGGTGGTTGGSPVTVAVPAIPVLTITSQQKSTNSVTMVGTATNYPVSGTAQVSPSGTPNGATAASVAITFDDAGNFSVTVPATPGNYLAPTTQGTNYSGTGTATGKAFTVYAAGTQPPGMPAVDLPAYTAPAFNAPSLADGAAVTTINIENTSTQTANNHPFTIGHPFKRGQLKTSDSLVGKMAGQPDLALQFDVRATWQDGSVRHGVISGILPSIAGSAVVPMDIARSTAVQDKTPLSPASMVSAGINARAVAVIGGVTYTAIADDELTAGRIHDTWLSGPIVTEYSVEARFKDGGGTPHPVLRARFDIRYYSSISKAKVDVTVENGDAYVTVADITYNASVTIAGTQVYSKAGLVHWWACRWKQQAWFGTASALHIKFDKNYLIDSKMIPNYDRTLVIAESTLANLYSDSVYVAGGGGYDVGPMGNGIYAPAMGTTGGRPEIGMNPRWVVDWILTQDKRAKKFSLLHADVGGSWPVHLRDRSTGPAAGYPLSTVYWPYASELGNPGDCNNPATGQNEKIYNGGSAAITIPDASHHAAFANVAYLLTGDAYYLEELMFWANFCSWVSNPYYRQFSQGLVSPDQTRGQAWAMRDIGYATALIPDAHPRKPDFKYVLDSNLADYNRTYTDNPSAVGLGAIATGGALAYQVNGATTLNGVSTWQDDFFTGCIGSISELGFSEATRLLLYKAKFPIGRLIAPGYCWIHAASYGLALKDDTGTWFTTLAQAYQATVSQAMLATACGSQAMADQIAVETGYPVGSVHAGEIPGFSYSAQGYPSNMQMGLCYAVDSGYTDGDLAWIQFMSRTVQPNYALDGAQFAIVPRMAIAGGGTPTVTSVTVSPATAIGSATFSATVAGSNSPSQAVTWMASAGSITSAGVFTAPAPTSTVQTITITATSAQNTSRSGTATVTIAAAAGVGSVVTGVSVSPASTILQGGAAQRFTASVLGTNSPSQGVVWSAVGGGSIDSTGNYTAPASIGAIQLVVITATSVQDNTKQGMASVTIPASTASTSLSGVTAGRLDATQFINHIPLGSSGKRLLTSLINGLVDDIHMVRSAQMVMAAKLDADPGVTGSDYVDTATVPDAKVILDK